MIVTMPERVSGKKVFIRAPQQKVGKIQGVFEGFFQYRGKILIGLNRQTQRQTKTFT